jgi:hypothetical protein
MILSNAMQRFCNHSKAFVYEEIIGYIQTGTSTAGNFSTGVFLLL